MIFKYPYTTRTTDCVYATEANRIEQYKKIIAVYCQDQTICNNALCGNIIRVS